MAEKKINTSQSMKEQVTDVEIKSVLGNMAAEYMAEPKVKMIIPKMLEARLGPVYSLMVNGVVVSIPVDGKAYDINETHAREIQERLAALS